MNKKNNIIGLFLLITLILATGCKKSDKFEEILPDPKTNFQYSILPDEKSVGIIRYLGENNNIVIPSLINELPVTEIGQQAFREIGLRSVIIPESVTIIGAYSFSTSQSVGAVSGGNLPGGMSLPINSSRESTNWLTSVNIPDSVTIIGDHAFVHNPINSINIGNSVTSIGISAFQGNLLTSVVIPDSVKSIGSRAFYSIMQSKLDRNNNLTITYDNNIHSIKIGSNVELGGRTSSFRDDFDNFYNENGKMAGTYVYNNNEWIIK